MEKEFGSREQWEQVSERSLSLFFFSVSIFYQTWQAYIELSLRWSEWNAHSTEINVCELAMSQSKCGKGERKKRQSRMKKGKN